MILHDSMMTIHRAKYKLDFLQTMKGRPTGLEYGFLKCCEALQQNFNNDNMILCWEGRDNFRRHIFPEYKANRREKIQNSDNPLARLDYNRIDEFKKFLEHPFTNAEAEHYEADDVIATLADKYKSKEKVVIYSNDKDLLQLIDENVTVVRSFREVNRSFIWDLDTVEQKYEGLLPIEIPIFLAFTGDASDNIPGVPRLRKPRLISAIIANRYSDDLIQGIMNYELWSSSELFNIEEFVKAGYLKRNLELIILRRPDVTIKEPTGDKMAIKDWLTEMEFRSLKLSKKVGVLEVAEDEEF